MRTHRPDSERRDVRPPSAESRASGEPPATHDQPGRRDTLSNESQEPLTLDEPGAPASPRPPRKRRRDQEALDSTWLEREALDVLARADSSRRGLRTKLERRLAARCERTGEDANAALDAIPALIESLAARGYVDDLRFATALYARERRVGRSRARIHATLIQKGVDSSTIHEVEAERRENSDSVADSRAGREHDDELAAAFRLARKRRLGPFCPDPEKRLAMRMRHLGVLARGGFSEEIAYHVVDAVLEDGEMDGVAGSTP